MFPTPKYLSITNETIPKEVSIPLLVFEKRKENVKRHTIKSTLKNIGIARKTEGSTK